jgi:hypothetical protein
MLNRFKKPFLPLLSFLGKKKMERAFDREPVIIGGCGRSGTTLLQSILSAHPSIMGFPKELSVFNYWDEKKERIRPLRIDRLYREVFIRKIPSEVRRWSEKTPRNVRHIERIMDYFDGRVKFIHIIRDGRDVVLSQHPDKKGYWVDPRRWVDDVKEGLKHADHPNVLTIYYENLVRDYEGTLKQILDFIGEPFASELKQWHEHTSLKKSNAWHEGVRKLSDRSIGKWRKKQNQSRVEAFMKNEQARKLLEQLGYPLH